MKKLALTIAIVLGISICLHAQEAQPTQQVQQAQQAQKGGLFGYGEVTEDENAYTAFALYAAEENQEYNEGLFAMLRAGNNPNLPGHGENTNQNAPLGSGALLLIGFGAAYAMKKRSKK